MVNNLWVTRKTLQNWLMLKIKFQLHPIPQNCHFPEIYFPIQLIFFLSKFIKPWYTPPLGSQILHVHTPSHGRRALVSCSPHTSLRTFSPPFSGGFAVVRVCVHFFSLACFTSLLLSPSDEPTDLFARTHTHTVWSDRSTIILYFLLLLRLLSFLRLSRMVSVFIC